MQIRIGSELIYTCVQPTPMILMLNIHFTRANDLVVSDKLVTFPPRCRSADIVIPLGTGAVALWHRSEKPESPPTP